MKRRSAAVRELILGGRRAGFARVGTSWVLRGRLAGAQGPDYLYCARLGLNYTQSLAGYFWGAGSGVLGASLLGFIDAEGVWERVFVEDGA